MKAKKKEAVAINSSIPWKERGKRLAEIDDEIEACDKHKKELERAVFFKFLLGALASAVTGIAVTAIAPAVAPAQQWLHRCLREQQLLLQNAL